MSPHEPQTIDRQNAPRALSAISAKITNAIPFKSAEEAWFWFMAAQQAREDGARFVAGQGAVPRPCEPLDILGALDRLYRMRCLRRDHFFVLRHYGQRNMAPDPRRAREVVASQLWGEAMERISEVLETKGIVEKKTSSAHPNWFQEAMLYENLNMEGACA